MCVAVAADLQEKEDVKEAIKYIRSIFSNRVSILINNAGDYGRIGIMETTPEYLSSQISLHVGSILQMVQAILPQMIEGEFGRIVSMSSASAFLGSESPAYAASKNAIIGLTRSLVKSVAQHNITANVVVPGPIETDMTRKMSKKRRQEMLKRVPSGRFGRVAEVVAPILFLCSEEASYINGTCLHVNGGLYFAD